MSGRAVVVLTVLLLIAMLGCLELAYQSGRIVGHIECVQGASHER